MLANRQANPNKDKVTEIEQAHSFYRHSFMHMERRAVWAMNNVLLVYMNNIAWAISQSCNSGHNQNLPVHY